MSDPNDQDGGSSLSDFEELVDSQFEGGDSSESDSNDSNGDGEE